MKHGTIAAQTTTANTSPAILGELVVLCAINEFAVEALETKYFGADFFDAG